MLVYSFSCKHGGKHRHDIEVAESSTSWPAVAGRLGLAQNYLLSYGFSRQFSWHGLFFMVFFLFACFRDRVFLCSPDCPGTHSVDQTGLELKSACLCLLSAGISMCHHCLWFLFMVFQDRITLCSPETCLLKGFQKSVSLCSPACPELFPVDQAGLKLLGICCFCLPGAGTKGMLGIGSNALN